MTAKAERYKPTPVASSGSSRRSARNRPSITSGRSPRSSWWTSRIVFIALGRNRWASLTTTAVCIAGHIGIAIRSCSLGARPRRLAERDGVANPADPRRRPDRAVPDVGLLARPLGATHEHRGARQLQSAMRVIGDQQQALIEVADAEKDPKRVDEGRWSGQQMGSYRSASCSGAAAMGEVYEAHGADGKPVAVKLLNARATASSAIVERFHREMKVAARLESPHHRAGARAEQPDAPVPYIAMEKLNAPISRSACARIHACRPTSLSSCSIRSRAAPRSRGARACASRSQAAQPVPPRRRDVEDPRLRRVEGARQRRHAHRPRHRRHAAVHGARAGVGWQRHASRRRLRARAIAYRCLTGRSPFKGKDLRSWCIRSSTRAHATSALGRVSISIEDVLAVAMAKDPRRRFSSRCRSRRRSSRRAAAAAGGRSARARVDLIQREQCLRFACLLSGPHTTRCGPRGRTTPRSGPKASKHLGARSRR